jgi:hypothetical protein
MWRSAPEPDRYLKQLAQDNPGVLRLFPLLPITYYAVAKRGARNLPSGNKFCTITITTKPTQRGQHAITQRSFTACKGFIVLLAGSIRDLG